MFEVFPSNFDIKIKYTLLFLCIFQAFLSFKPSEPYLSQYLICNKVTHEQECSLTNISEQTCISINQCEWIDDRQSCVLKQCNTIPSSECPSNDNDDTAYDYCTQDGDNNNNDNDNNNNNNNNEMCKDVYCQTNLSQDDVNNNVYPWSTFAYLPFLLAIGIYDLYIYIYIYICIYIHVYVFVYSTVFMLHISLFYLS